MSGGLLLRMSERTNGTEPAKKAPESYLPIPLGQVVATPAAKDACQHAGVSPMQLISRHAIRDWGDVDADDWKANDMALTTGARLMSMYILPTRVRVWIITEADRSATTVLLPSEY